MMSEHDSSYKLLFSYPEMVRDLLVGFVREPWVDDLDFGTLEIVSGSYVTDDLRDREDDIVWRVRLKGRWLYVYLLLEFQSTVDPYMAVRMMTYVGLLYQDLIRGKQLTPSDHLPPVLPVVLYNGNRTWTAAIDIRGLIEPVPGGLDRYQPQLSYLLLDESRYSESELEPLRNLVAALFRLENSRQTEDIQQVLTALVEWLAAPEQHGLQRAFTVWLRRVLLPGRLPGVAFPALENLQEVRSMLAERVIDWTRQWREEGLEAGRQEGLKEGMEEGMKEGESTVLLRQLERKFGPLEESQRRCIRNADSDTLLEWSDRVLTAASWEEVVGS